MGYNESGTAAVVEILKAKKLSRGDLGKMEHTMARPTKKIEENLGLNVEGTPESTPENTGSQENEGTPEEKKEDVPEPEKKVEEVVAEVVAVIVPKKKDMVAERRTTVSEKVHAAMVELNGKEIKHTDLFHHIYPDAPEGKDSVMKWHDIGKALTEGVNAGTFTMKTQEGKRRTTFRLAKVAEEAAAPESTPEGEKTGE